MQRPHEYTRRTGGIKTATDWHEVAEFDFTVYSVEDWRKCNEDFSQFLVDGLLRLPPDVMPDNAERVTLAERFTECAFAHFGRHLDKRNLYFLSNLCLLDFINMPKRNKTMNEKDGFLTPRQLYERSMRERSLSGEALDFHFTKRLFPDLLPQQRNTQPININSRN